MGGEFAPGNCTGASSATFRTVSDISKFKFCNRRNRKKPLRKLVKVGGMHQESSPDHAHVFESPPRAHLPDLGSSEVGGSRYVTAEVGCNPPIRVPTSVVTPEVDFPPSPPIFFRPPLIFVLQNHCGAHLFPNSPASHVDSPPLHPPEPSRSFAPKFGRLTVRPTTVGPQPLDEPLEIQRLWGRERGGRKRNDCHNIRYISVTKLGGRYQTWSTVT